LRFVDLICSIVVFGSVSSVSSLSVTNGVCWYGISVDNNGVPQNENSACGFGTAIGVLSFLFDLLILSVIYLPLCFPNPILMPTIVPLLLFLFGCFAPWLVRQCRQFGVRVQRDLRYVLELLRRFMHGL